MIKTNEEEIIEKVKERFPEKVIFLGENKYNSLMYELGKKEAQKDFEDKIDKCKEYYNDGEELSNEVSEINEVLNKLKSSLKENHNQQIDVERKPMILPAQKISGNINSVTADIPLSQDESGLRIDSVIEENNICECGHEEAHHIFNKFHNCKMSCRMCKCKKFVPKKTMEKKK